MSDIIIIPVTAKIISVFFLGGVLLTLIMFISAKDFLNQKNLKYKLPGSIEAG